jgi:AraC-like DNA-binding protein
MSSSAEILEKAPTGIRGFDEITRGGLPHIIGIVCLISVWMLNVFGIRPTVNINKALGVLSVALHAGQRAAGAHPPRARAGTRRQHRDLVEHAKEILATRPGERLTLPQVAREANSSPFHLTRVFRAELGVPLHQYLLRLRLALAVERMDQGERSLSVLALDLGFASHAHFTAAFRRCFGVPPSRFAGAGRLVPVA